MGSPLYTNSAEGGTNGTTVTTANSGAGSGNAFSNVTLGSGTFVFTSTTPIAGSLSYLVTPAAGSQTYALLSAAAAGANFSFSVRVSLTGLPSAITEFISLQDSVSAWPVSLSLNTDGRLRLIRTGAVTLGNFTTAMSLNTDYRITLFGVRSSTVGSVTAKLYQGTTLLETLGPYTGLNLGTTDPIRAMVGKFTSAPSMAAFRHDNWQFSVTDASEITPEDAWLESSNFEIGTSMGSANPQPLPPGAEAGDLIIYVTAVDNTASVNTTASGGWTASTVRGTTGMRSKVFGRVISGPTDTISLTGAAQDYVVIGHRIPSGAHNIVTAPSGTPGSINDWLDPYSPSVLGASGNADPPNLAPSGVTSNHLIIVAAALDMTATGDTISADPTNYLPIQSQKSASSTSSVGLRTARRFSALPEDPGTFTNTSRAWHAWTIAVPSKVITIPSEDTPIGHRASGVFTDRPVKYKSGGVFTTRSLKRKSGGVWLG